MYQVYITPNSFEAHIVEHQLDCYEIPCEIWGEFLWGARGELPLLDTWPTIWIYRAEDLEQAHQIVAAHHAQEPDGEPVAAPWLCPGCGETLDAQFDVCWQCGRGKP